MADSPATTERELMRRWVETWRQAGEELALIREREIRELDTREAIRQIFSAGALTQEPPRATSGLIEQQAWFARLRR